jgi:hypothetical protein
MCVLKQKRALPYTHDHPNSARRKSGQDLFSLFYKEKMKFREDKWLAQGLCA